MNRYANRTQQRFIGFHNNIWNSNPKQARAEEIRRVREKAREADKTLDQIANDTEYREGLESKALLQSAQNAAYTKFTEAVIELTPAENGLISLFGLSEDNIFDGDEVEYDILRYKRKVPTAKDRNEGFSVNEVNGYRNCKFAPPLYKESVPFNFHQLPNRLAGTTQYDVNGARGRAVMRQVVNSMGWIKRTFDLGMTWQAAQLFQTGTIPFKSVGGSKTVEDLDLGCPAGNFANSVTLKIADIEAHIEQIETSNDGNYKIDNIIFGVDALSAFMSDADNKTELDNRRIDRGNMTFEERQMNGFQRVGLYNFNGVVVALWTFKSYYDDNGTTTNFIGDTKVVMFSSDGDYQRYHAGVPVTKEIGQMSQVGEVIGSENVTIVSDLVAVEMHLETKELSTSDNTGVYLQGQTAPLLIARTNDSFGALTYTG